MVVGLCTQTGSVQLCPVLWGRSRLDTEKEILMGESALEPDPLSLDEVPVTQRVASWSSPLSGDLGNMPPPPGEWGRI